VDLPACAAPPPHVALKGPTFTREGGATVMMSSATTRATRHQSAIVFTSELARRLEDDPSLRLPTTYAGVRRVRPANGFRPEVSSRKRKSACRESDTSSQVDAHQGANKSTARDGASTCDVTNQPSKTSKPASSPRVVFKVTNPDGTERRMTSQEKKQYKLQLKKAKHANQKQERQVQHEERIRKAKQQKRQRKEMKRLAKHDKDSDSTLPNEDKEPSQGSATKKPVEDFCVAKEAVSSFKDIDLELAELLGERRGIPPVILTPAATCVAQDLGVLPRSTESDEWTITLDRELSAHWADQLGQSFEPVEESRSKEDMREMPYRVAPETWKRLCPDSLWECRTDLSKEGTGTAANNDDHATAQMRDPSSSYDLTSYLIFRHLQRNSKLHIACGALFGCDFVLYDGKRSERHSFAGLRIYSSRSNSLPTPSPYDMTGYVRAMTSARKMALVATAVIDERTNSSRLAICELASEKILTAKTHIRKGHTEKRKAVEELDMAKT